MSVQNAIYNQLSPLFFPKQVKNSSKPDASEIFSETFKKNYIYEKSLSCAIGSSFILSGVVTVGSSISYGIISTTTLSSLVAAGALGFAWYRSVEKSYDLALSAYRSMSQGNETEALDFIKSGANIYQDFSHLSIKGGTNPNLLIQAAQYGCGDVVKFLANLGWDLNESASALGRAPNLEMVQLLVQLGADVNLYKGRESTPSPLFIQLRNLSSHLENPSSIDLNFIETKFQIIEFLIEVGAKLQENPPRYKEKTRAAEQFEKDLKKIAASTLTDSIKLRVKESIKKIYDKSVASS